MINREEFERLQALEGQYRGMAASEAEKSSFLSSEETMKRPTEQHPE